MGSTNIGACTAVAERFYGSAPPGDESFTRSGATVFEAGCQDAANRLPRLTDYQLGGTRPTAGDPDLLDDEID